MADRQNSRVGSFLTDLWTQLFFNSPAGVITLSAFSAVLTVVLSGVRADPGRALMFGFVAFAAVAHGVNKANAWVYSFGDAADRRCRHRRRRELVKSGHELIRYIETCNAQIDLVDQGRTPGSLDKETSEQIIRYDQAVGEWTRSARSSLPETPPHYRLNFDAPRDMTKSCGLVA